MEREKARSSIELYKAENEKQPVVEQKELNKTEIRILGGGSHMHGIDELFNQDPHREEHFFEFEFKFWDKPHVGQLITNLHKDKIAYSIDKDSFEELIGGGWHEELKLFDWEEIPEWMRKQFEKKYKPRIADSNARTMLLAWEHWFQGYQSDQRGDTEYYLIEKDISKGPEFVESDIVHAKLESIFDQLTKIVESHPEYFTVTDPDIIYKIRDQVYRAMQKVDKDQADAEQKIRFGQIQKTESPEGNIDTKSLIQQKLLEAEKNFQTTENEEDRKRFEDQYKRLASLEMYRAALATGVGQTAIDTILSAKNQGGFTDEEKKIFDMIIEEYSPRK